MSALALQAVVVNVSLKTDVGADNTYKEVVCLTDFSVKNSLDNTVVDTFCGPFVGLGLTKFTCSFNAVFNTNVDTSIEVSANQLQTWMTSLQRLSIRVEYPTVTSAGTTYYRQGFGYITDCSETGAIKDILKFAVTFTGDGTLDTTA